MNKVIKVVLIIVVIFAVLILLRDQLIKMAVVATAKQVAGVNVTIGSLKLSLISQSMQIKDLKVYNPDGFPTDKVMVDIPEIAVKVDVGSFFSNALHLPYMRLDLKEARIIKSKAGALNVNSLKFAQPSGQAKRGAGSSPSSAKEPGKEMKMQLDLVSLNIGTIYVEDFTSGKEKPRLTVLKLNIHNSEYKNVTSPVELGSLVMFQALTPAGLNGAFSIGDNLFDQGTGTVGSVVNSVGVLFKSFKKGSRQ